MDATQELAALLWANIPLVNVVTYEEDRVVRILESIEGTEALGMVSWDLADGFKILRDGKESFPVKDCTTDTVLTYFASKAPDGTVLVLRDFHHSWNQKRAYITRKLRNMAASLRARSQFLFFITPEADLPLELKDDVVVLHLPLPDESEITHLFDDVTTHLDGVALPTPGVKEKLIDSALGLTSNQVRMAFSRVLARHGCFDERGIELVIWAKREVIRENGALEFWPESEGEAEVGGLDLLKNWLKKRALGFTREARCANVPLPRGVALIGIPGTGKSLSAKMLSGIWKMPLLRLDVGALFGSYLGESEANMRQAIRLAETVSPCILWIDELEKAFAGSTPGNAGATNGAASRVFGTFLTWMQEHRSPVFVLATANDIEQLPPELLARFDRTFFLDLPGVAERREIFSIRLKRAGEAFPERRFQLEALAQGSVGFVGREIEQVVREAQFTALADCNREIEQEDLVDALGEVVPLSKSHAHIIQYLRQWKTEGRAFPASSASAAEKKI
jgi:hypothetical protein